MTTALLRASLLGLALLALPLTSAAQGVLNLSGLGSQKDAPIEVTADALTVDQATNVATFVGNVLIIQADTRISAGQAIVHYDANSSAIARLDLSGGVTLVTPTDAAESETAEYNMQQQKLLLIGKVLVTQGSNVIGAERMDIDLATGAAQLDGRVRTLMSPVAQ